MTTLACPFCGDTFPSSERDTCPQCGLLLMSLEELQQPAIAEEPPDDSLSWFSPEGGRGLVVALAMGGLASFFTPWLEVATPTVYRFSGFALAGDRGFWFGGGAVAWTVLVALVASRRSHSALRGVRAVAGILASVTAWQALFLVAVTDTSSDGLVQHRFAYGFYVAAALSALAAAVALRLGKEEPDARPSTPPTAPSSPDSKPTLH
jgi:hypothetical protein